MMNRKTLLNLAGLPVLFLGLGTLTQAQTTPPPAPASPSAPVPAAPGTPPKAGKHKGGKMMEELNLTEDQKAKLKPLLESEKQELSGVKENNALAKDQQLEQMKAIHDKYKSQIAAILTPEQQAKLKELKQEKRAAKAKPSA